jgi:hypothetical protein
MARMMGLFAMLVLLAACGGGADSAAKSSTAAKPVVAKPVPVDDDSVAAVRVSERDLPATVRFLNETDASAGQLVRVRLKIGAIQPIDSLKIEVTDVASIRIAESSAKILLPAIPAGQVVEQVIEFTPQSAGLSVIDLRLTADTASGAMQASYTVPVLIRETAKKP